MQFQKASGGGGGSSSCKRYPESMEVTRTTYPKKMGRCGHVHMSAAEAPWDLADAARTNMKAELRGEGERQLKDTIDEFREVSGKVLVNQPGLVEVENKITSQLVM